MAFSQGISLKNPLIWLGLVIELILISLGAWQYSRWEEKKEKLEHLQTQLSQAPVHGEELSQDFQFVFRKARLKGHFLHLEEKHLQARVDKGRLGVHVVTPFRLDDGRVILVNRGWVTMAGLPFLKRPRRTIPLEGVILPLSRINLFTPPNDPAQNTWYRLSPGEMFPDTSFKQTYLRVLQPGEDEGALLKSQGLSTYQHHIGYMLTWWGLGVLLLVFILGTIFYDKKKVRQRAIAKPS
ncbi:MAG: SURF1 family protein [Alphaproteobacteria bacterium]